MYVCMNICILICPVWKVSLFLFIGMYVWVLSTNTNCNLQLWNIEYTRETEDSEPYSRVGKALPIARISIPWKQKRRQHLQYEHYGQRWCPGTWRQKLPRQREGKGQGPGQNRSRGQSGGRQSLCEGRRASSVIHSVWNLRRQCRRSGEWEAPRHFPKGTVLILSM